MKIQNNKTRGYALAALFAGTAMLAVTSKAALLLYGPFNYPLGDLVGNSGGGSFGFVGPWQKISGQINVLPGSFTNPAALPSFGNHIGSSGPEGLYSRLTNPTVLNTLLPGQDRWITFLADFTSVPDHSDATVRFNMGSPDALVGIDYNSPHDFSLVLGNANADIFFDPPVIPTLYKIHLQREADLPGGGNNFLATLYSPDKPTLVKDLVPLAAVSATLPGYGGSPLNTFLGLGLKNAGIDEIRVGNFDSDTEAVPVPEPATMAALALGVAGLIRRRRQQQN